MNLIESEISRIRQNNWSYSTMAGATGFASIVFGYPHALWGLPQIPEYEG